MDAELTTTSLGYSLKNIPVPSRKEYKKQLIEKTQDVIKRMRWKAFHFLKGAEDRDDDEDDRDSNKETYGFKSRKCPPRIDEMKAFENDVYGMIEDVAFRETSNSFQQTLKRDLKRIKDSSSIVNGVSGTLATLLLRKILRWEKERKREREKERKR